MNKKKLKYALFSTAIACFIGLLCPFSTFGKNDSKISLVVIDPGHGGKDPGAQIGNTQEKDIVLSIALKLGQTISESHPDVKVIYTRTGDVFVPLHKRADIANKNDADLFISIHVNSVDVKSVQGSETFVLGLHRNRENLEVAQKENSVIQLEDNYRSTYEDFDPNSDESYIMFANVQEEFQKQSVLMASYIQNEFKNHAKRPDRSVKMAGFLVLRETTMPSVLIETGFLSHTRERSYLTSEGGQNALAESIYRAFSLYKKEIEERSTFNLVTEDVEPASLKSNTSNTTPTSQIQTRADNENATNEKETIAESDLFFSVQIMALKRKVEPTPQNFQQEKNIFRVDGADINRYFSGKFKSHSLAEDELLRLQKKYPNAFVVAFRDNRRISLKKALENR